MEGNGEHFVPTFPFQRSLVSSKDVGSLNEQDNILLMKRVAERK